MSRSSTWPAVSVVIPNWNTRRWLPGCLDGLLAQTCPPAEVILVDNGSTDDSVAFVRENYPHVEIIAFPENRGFAPAVNAGIERSRSAYVALLNVDTVPQPGWLAGLVETLVRSGPEVGAVASKMLRLENPDLIDNAGDLLSWYGSARKRGQGEPAQAYMQEVEIFSACAGAALYRRSFLAEVGGLDENFISYLEDVDLGLRGRLLGYRCLYAPTAEVLHQGHGAGLPTARYVYLMTRNRLTLLLKNIPARLLLKYSGRLLYGQFYFFLVYKKPLRSLAGTLAALAALPRIWRERQAIQQHRRISDQALETMLSEELGEPSLQELVKSKLTLTFNYFIRKDRA